MEIHLWELLSGPMAQVLEYSVRGNLYLPNRFFLRVGGPVELSLVNKLSVRVCACVHFKCSKLLSSDFGFLVLFCF